MKYILLTLLVVLVGCGQSKSSLHKISKEKLGLYVNPGPMPKDPNLTLDKSIENTSYPIQIALYEDGRFFYDLPNLGEGKGTWKNNNGVIELRAKRTIFDMYIEVKGNDETASSVSVEFTDRFGPNVLKMRNINF